jgi:hypothetical protein
VSDEQLRLVMFAALVVTFLVILVMRGSNW